MSAPVQNGTTADLGEMAPRVNGSDSHADLEELLVALQAMRDGSFGVRLRGDRVGLAGKVADTFNEIVANNQRMAEQLERVGEMVCRQG
jgi:monomeric isocitrate dehydrogenase